VVVVVGWMLRLVDTAKMKMKKNSPFFFVTPFFVSLNSLAIINAQ
jgi:hypothetical protein